MNEAGQRAGEIFSIDALIVSTQHSYYNSYLGHSNYFGSILSRRESNHFARISFSRCGGERGDSSGARGAAEQEPAALAMPRGSAARRGAVFEVPVAKIVITRTPMRRTREHRRVMATMPPLIQVRRCPFVREAATTMFKSLRAPPPAAGAFTPSRPRDGNRR